MLNSGEKDSCKVIRKMEEIIKKEKSARIEYVSIVNEETLEVQERIKGQALLALAVWIGKTRLIDNLLFETEGRG